MIRERIIELFGAFIDPMWKDGDRDQGKGENGFTEKQGGRLKGYLMQTGQARYILLASLIHDWVQQSQVFSWKIGCKRTQN